MGCFQQDKSWLFDGGSYPRGHRPIFQCDSTLPQAVACCMPRSAFPFLKKEFVMPLQIRWPSQKFWCYLPVKFSITKCFMTLSLTNHLRTIKSHTSTVSSYFMTQLKKTLLFWCTIKCGLKAQHGFRPPPMQSTQTVQTSVESEVAPNKKRKMTRHSTSKGQIVSQVKKSISTKSVSNTTSHEFDDIRILKMSISIVKILLLLMMQQFLQLNAQ